MHNRVAAGACAALLSAGGGPAEPAAYMWTGMGTGVDGSSKCATYKMTIDVTVDGKSVKGVLHQQGRDERRFEATLGDGGVFKAKAEVGAGNMLEVTGTITDTESRI